MCILSSLEQKFYKVKEARQLLIDALEKMAWIFVGMRFIDHVPNSLGEKPIHPLSPDQSAIDR
jgi:hypothetical protein